MLLDCAIIGGGPAGLNAALVLGRARRNVILIDDNKPRNAITHESHGFITRDGVRPSEFRNIAYQDIRKYPSVRFKRSTVVEMNNRNAFQLTTSEGETIRARKVILATGLKDTLPAVAGIHDFYGKSLFSCPYCDGWELRDKPLVVISETEHVFHMAKIVFQWSPNVLLCTNGHHVLTPEQKGLLRSKGITVYEQRIHTLVGDNGRLKKIVFTDRTEVHREGGFVTPHWSQAAPFGEILGCETHPLGGIVTDDFGRTSVEGVFAAGDTAVIAPSQLIIAAAEGSRAAIGVNTDLTLEDF